MSDELIEHMGWRVQRLRLDAAAAQAFEHFDRAGVNARLLKGRSITSWLYSNHDVRPQADYDVLVAPSDLDAAEAILVALGYERSWDDRQMPAWWREHSGEWLRQRDNVTVDLHRRLPGVGINPEAAWRALSRDPAMVPVGGREVPALALPARALHIALHAAHHGTDQATPIEDLQRAVNTADDATWLAAWKLARELAAADAFTAGLRLDPVGAALAERMGLPSRVSVEAALVASSPPPVALGLEQLARAPGIRARMGIVAYKLIPPPDFIRHWDPRATRSRVALLRAYLRRPVWVLGRTPAGLSAWWRARARARG